VCIEMGKSPVVFSPAKFNVTLRNRGAYNVFWTKQKDDEFCISIRGSSSPFKTHLYVLLERLLEEVPKERLKHAATGSWQYHKGRLYILHPENIYCKVYSINKNYEFLAWYDWQLKAYMEFKRQYLAFYDIDTIEPPLIKLFFYHNERFVHYFKDMSLRCYFRFEQPIPKAVRNQIIEHFGDEGKEALAQHEAMYEKIKKRGINIWYYADGGGDDE